MTTRYACSQRAVYACCVGDVCLALRTCAVQRLLSSRLAWQIRRGSCALVENKAHRLLECLTDSHTLVGVSRRWLLVWPLLLSSLCTTILSPWPRRHGQCRCSLRPCQQRHVRPHRPLFSASDSIATPERYFATLRLGGWESQVSPATAPNQTA